MSDTKYAVRKIGQHEICYEPDTGFTFFVQVGQINRAEAVEMAALVSEYTESSGEPIFMLADDRKAAGVDSEARSVFAANKAVRREILRRHVRSAVFAAHHRQAHQHGVDASRVQRRAAHGTGRGHGACLADRTEACVPRQRVGNPVAGGRFPISPRSVNEVPDVPGRLLVAGAG